MMGSLFNIKEVFSMAIQMEDNGAAFYRRAAELHAGPYTGTLVRLAEMEEQHKATFTRMRDEIAAKEEQGSGFDLYDEGELYLAGIAGGYRVEGSPTVTEQLTGKESLTEILRTAVELEKQAILFYLGLRDVVPEYLGGEHLDMIIGEEKGHVAILMGEIRKVQAEKKTK